MIPLYAVHLSVIGRGFSPLRTRFLEPIPAFLASPSKSLEARLARDLSFLGMPFSEFPRMGVRNISTP